MGLEDLAIGLVLVCLWFFCLYFLGLRLALEQVASDLSAPLPDGVKAEQVGV